jgi:hypothetical protein
VQEVEFWTIRIDGVFNRSVSNIHLSTALLFAIHTHLRCPFCLRFLRFLFE